MTNIKPYKNQDYNLLEEQHSTTRLFIDPEYPACFQSISHTGALDVTNEDGDNILKYIEWRRPHEIIDNPHFVIDGFQRRDIGQGQLGNCWFVAAAGALTLNSELMAKVIPNDQTFDASDYTGMFHFRFWLFGAWNDVVIDDRLPCYKGRFVFCRNNKDPNELWAPLLEKAYAKVCGSYELMAGGQITDGLIDFTGGLDESIMLNLPSTPPDFKAEVKRLIYQAMARKSMVGCAIIPQADDPSEAHLPNGLIAGHAFSVTQVKDLTTPNGVVTLVRCMNPWNDSTEWNGAWSDNSTSWDKIPEVEKRKLKFSASHDGEFWMSFDDFFTNFHEIQICHRSPESVGLLETAPSAMNGDELFAWYEEMFHGTWKTGESAGGSGLQGEPPEKYWTNPQYLIKLDSTDHGTEEHWCTTIIALMFKEERQRIFNGEETVCIAFDVYRIKDDVVIRTHIDERQKFYMTDLDYVGNSGEHTPYRSVSKRFKARPGPYIIIPNTLNYNERGEYFLRIFTEKGADPTVAIELTSNKENLTESEINRPHIKIDSKVDSKPDATSESPAEEETNNDTEETNDNAENINTESENERPDVKVDDTVDSEPVSTPKSSNKQRNNAEEVVVRVFPSSKPTKPSTNINVNNKEGYCTIQ